MNIITQEQLSSVPMWTELMVTFQGRTEPLKGKIANELPGVTVVEFKSGLKVSVIPSFDTIETIPNQEETPQ